MCPKNETNVHCRQCGSEKVRSQVKQVRRADEAMSCDYECTDCGKKWRVG
ncbi:MAG: hypothetical protein HGB14_09210 [Anaerolineaceae bacterium]|nr:hypothetical protein [Anaerolineaceae bacterium]